MTRKIEVPGHLGQLVTCNMSYTVMGTKERQMEGMPFMCRENYSQVLSEMPTSGDLKSGDCFFSTPASTYPHPLPKKKAITLIPIKQISPQKNRLRASNVYLNLTPRKLKEDFRGLPKTSEVDPKISEVPQRLLMISDVDPKTFGVELKSSEDLSEEGF